MKERSGYGDADTQRIIERAAEIDAERGHALDAPALREIATEAGISRLAVDRALQEHETAVPIRLPWLKRHRMLLTIVAIVAALLFVAVMRIAGPPQP